MIWVLAWAVKVLTILENKVHPNLKLEKLFIYSKKINKKVFSEYILQIIFDIEIWL